MKFFYTNFHKQEYLVWSAVQSYCQTLDLNQKYNNKFAYKSNTNISTLMYVYSLAMWVELFNYERTLVLIVLSCNASHLHYGYKARIQNMK